MKKQAMLTTSKMLEETEQQYTAFLLYCETGSIPKLIKAWEKICREDVGEVSATFRDQLGKIPAERTIERWSTKFRWVERSEMRRFEVLEELNEKAKKIESMKVHKIAEAFDRVTNKILSSLQRGAQPTINEWKQVWEMFRIELGQTTNKHEIVKGIDESEQYPPTPEEQEYGRVIDQAIKDYYDNKFKGEAAREKG